MKLSHLTETYLYHVDIIKLCLPLRDQSASAQYAIYKHLNKGNILWEDCWIDHDLDAQA